MSALMSTIPFHGAQDVAILATKLGVILRACHGTKGLADPVQMRRPSGASRRAAAPGPWHSTSFRSQSRNTSPGNAIFCTSLLPPSEPLLRSLQRATDGPLARRGSSSQVFDLACFVGNDGQRREQRL